MRLDVSISDRSVQDELTFLKILKSKEKNFIGGQVNTVAGIMQSLQRRECSGKEQWVQGDRCFYLKI